MNMGNKILHELRDIRDVCNSSKLKDSGVLRKCKSGQMLTYLNSSTGVHLGTKAKSLATL